MIYRPQQFNEQQRLRSSIILDAIEQLDGLIQANSPIGAQQTLALRHLEDVAMRVNKAISEESFDAIITYTEPCPPRSSSGETSFDRNAHPQSEVNLVLDIEVSQYLEDSFEAAIKDAEIEIHFGDR